jgi:hypothetical protein
MEEQKAIEIIQALAEGVDPCTGEVLPDDSPYKKPQIIKAFSVAKESLDYIRRRKDRLKNLPKRAGKPWSENESSLLSKRLEDGIEISEIASLHKRTTGSIRSRLARLGIKQ